MISRVCESRICTKFPGFLKYKRVQYRNFSGSHNLMEPTKLPRLPIPQLDDALNLYLQSLKPLTNKEEYEKNVKAVEEFKSPDGMGRILLERLKERDRNSNTSWLFELWNRHAYMSYRAPVVPEVSYFFAFKNKENITSQPIRAALITSAALKYRELILSNQLPVDLVRQTPQCMKQYDWLFHSCRIPRLMEDEGYSCPEPRKHNYFVVVCNDNYYLVDFQENEPLLGTRKLEKIFARIIEKSKYNESDSSIGHLTLANRDLWAQRYAVLLDHQNNKESFAAIQNAAFIVSLDEGCPEDLESLSRACWLGSGRNRYNDKALQFIIFKNGEAGFVGEHSCMDAVPTRNLCDYILSFPSSELLNSDSPVSAKDLRKLRFSLDPEDELISQKCLDKFRKSCDKKFLKLANFTKFGHERIKQLKISPDSFVQMAFQLAYYRTHGTFVPVYESASTRRFSYGRTDVIRPLSEKSKKWVLLSCSTASNTEKYNALQEAVEYLRMYVSKCSSGQGVDRFLLGLENEIKKGEEVPALFTNSAYKASSNWVMSTSQISSEHFCGYGWSYVVEGGYGLPYIINKDNILVTVTSNNSQNATEFAQNVQEAFLEMETCCQKEINNQSAKPNT